MSRHLSVDASDPAPAPLLPDDELAREPLEARPPLGVEFRIGVGKRQEGVLSELQQNFESFWREYFGRLVGETAKYLVDDDAPVGDAWDERERVEAGTLELTGPDEEREKGDDVLVFDPTRVVDGIELSDDPILRFRPRAYSVSVAHRTSG